MKKLKHRFMQGGAVFKPGTSYLRGQSTARRIAGVAIVLAVTTARAENPGLDFNLIKLPTDLIAAVSNVEDDIAISSLLQSAASQSEIGQSASEQSNVPAPSTAPSAVTNQQSVSDQIASSGTINAVEPQSDSGVQTVAEEALEAAETEDHSIPEIIVTRPVTAGTEVTFAVAAISEPATKSVEDDIASAPTTEPIGITEITPPGNSESVSDEPTTAQIAAVVPSQRDQTIDGTAAENGIQAKTVNQLVTDQQDALINEDEIILAWATAWSTNDIEKYLSFYSEEFIPDDASQDRLSWEQLRRERLRNKNIRIIVSNAEVYRVDNQIIEVRFTQRYTSKSYHDRVIKSIEMTETSSGWKFLSERTIESLPFE
ncbi:MAG: hypothetical protein WBM41_13145 [Arenicellales bacterium]